MIKRIVIFLLLLAAGFAALLLLVDDQQGAQAQNTEPALTTERPPGSTGPTLITQDRGQQIGVRINGAFQLNAERYRLSCRDSQPIGDGRQRLQDMVAEIYDEGRHAADLRASEAVVELAQDERGNATIKQDKDVLMQNAVLTSVPTEKVPPLRFELEQARLHFLEQGTELSTPGEHDPVLLVTEGQSASRLEGEGLEATLPNDKQAGSAPRLFHAKVLHTPVFTTAQAVVHSRGPFELHQDMDTGGGLLTAVEDVRLDLQDQGGASLPGSGAARSGAVTVTGDRLEAWLRHERQPGGPATGGHGQWTLLRMGGAPAIARGQDSVLQGPQLSVLPGLDGKPYLLTATGGACELVQTDAKGAVSRFTAARTLHLLRPGAPAAAVYQSFGFPAWTLGQLEHIDAAVFLGASTAAMPEGRVTASDGMWLMRRSTAEQDSAAHGQADAKVAEHGQGDAVAARGHGQVEVTRTESGQEVTAIGNDGFRLARTPAGDTLSLGPADAAAGADHHYTIRNRDVVVSGSGACRFEHLTDGRAKAILRSSRPDIDGELGARGSVHGATAVDADLLPAADPEATPVIERFVASGPRLHGTLTEDGTTYDVTAARIERDRTGRWDLTGDGTELATLQHGDLAAPAQDGRDLAGLVTAPRIVLHELGPRCAVVEGFAEGEQRAEMRTAPDRNGYAMHLWADHLRALPFAVPRQVLDAHLGGIGAQLGWTPGFELVRPWLTARGNVIADVTEPHDAASHAEGALMLVAGGSQSALFFGDPDAQQTALVTRRQGNGSRTDARAPRIQLSRQDETVRLLPTWPGLPVSVLPHLELHDPHARDSHSIANLAGDCRGEIEVFGDRVLFHGPVRAHELTPAGAEDPNGMHLDAEQLDMTLDRETHHVVRVDGRQRVRLDWSRIAARAQELSLDLISHEVTVRARAVDPEPAEVTLPNGLHAKAVQAVANYQTQSLTSWHSRWAMASPHPDGTHADRKGP